MLGFQLIRSLSFGRPTTDLTTASIKELIVLSGALANVAFSYQAGYLLISLINILAVALSAHSLFLLLKCALSLLLFLPW